MPNLLGFFGELLFMLADRRRHAYRTIIFGFTLYLLI